MQGLLVAEAMSCAYLYRSPVEPATVPATCGVCSMNASSVGNVGHNCVPELYIIAFYI